MEHSTNQKPYVLVIEDDADTRANLVDILELTEHRPVTAATAREALARDDWARVSTIILDRRLPDGTAEELLPRLKKLAPQAGVIIVTGYADVEGAINALRLGAADYILKPINPDLLQARLAQLTEHSHLALANKRGEAVFRTLVETAPSMIIILRPDQSIAYFSPFAEELTGHKAAEVAGRDYLELFVPEEHRKSVAHLIREAFARAAIQGHENPAKCRDGSLRWVVWNARFLADYEGGPALMMVGQDITSLKGAQERALQSERLAAIGQMVTGLAHESGNALARSQACLEMLALEVGDQPQTLDLINRIQKAQDHLRQLYDEVRGYAAPIKLEQDLWDVSGIWRQAWQNLAMLRQNRQAELREICGNLDLHCWVDHFRLEQVFRNILENSLAACADPVEIIVQCSETRLHGRPALRIAVRDNGPGLSSEQKKRIFEPFFTTKTKGTGLGMAIARRIIEAHRGQIAIGSEQARGAEIIMVLPRTTD
jgi:two-component system sensor kinase FixL